MKANTLYILLVLSFFCFQKGIAQELGKNEIPKQDAIKKDSAKTISKKAQVDLKKGKKPTVEVDSTRSDSIIKPKEVIEYKILHNAQDYTIQNAKNKTITLYNEAEVDYGDINLKAGKIIIDYKNNTVYATGIKDSTGYVQRPVFKQGNQESEQDSILYNFKSEKALIYGIKTVQGEMITYGEKTKRINDSTVYMSKLRFTTSKKKIPDYYIATNKAKLVPGKKIIVGGSNLVLADVPTPLYLPFAYFPLTKGRTSGFIIPTWGENNQQGFFLQNGGYYFAVNDYFDLELTGDIYSNGSWAINSNSSYRARYKYSGRLSFRYQNLTNGIKGFSDFSKSANYNISWSHRQDPKTSPNSNLTASVNLSSSSQFFRQSLNQIDQGQQFNNSFNSSISYYKNFVGTPFNTTVTLSHQQNSNNESITMTLPSVQVNMDRIYPFAGKGGVKKNPIQKIGTNYNLQGRLDINTNEEDFLTSKMFEGARSGIRHEIRANTNIKAFKYFTLTPSFNYSDVWYFNSIRKRYDTSIPNTAAGNSGTVVNDTISGFNRFNGYNFGVSLNTRIYGNFSFKKGRVSALRHTIIPTVSWSFRPNFAEQHELTVQQSDDPTDLLTYTPFEGGIYGTPQSGVSNLLTFAVNNTLEAKVKPKDEDSDEEDRKVTLINNLNFSTSYNIAADSVRWSKVNFNMGIPLFKNKMMLNFSGTMDPYQLNESGQRINKFNPGLFRLENLSLTTGYSLSSKDFEKKDDDKKEDQNNNTDSNNLPDPLGTNTNPNRDFANRASTGKSGKREEKVAELYNNKMPWNLSFTYGIAYNNNGISSAGIRNHVTSFNGSIDLTPKWKLGVNSGYNFTEGAFTNATFNFTRDLDSWRFNFNWTPFGRFTSYYFFIGIKSSMLSDLKWDKNQPPDRRLF
ncbi:LPS-assembly protein [Tenacibaculum sp. 190524A05c]